MITDKQLTKLAKRLQAPEAVVFREYMQLLFLDNLYSASGSENIIFKGGTAVHLMYQAPRFSEDLDFTVHLSEKDFEDTIAKIFQKITSAYEVTFKPRKTIVGRKYLLTAKPNVLKHETFISLDFSFRETVNQIEKSPLNTQFPLISSASIYFMGKDEIIAEKIRAILTREKGRDLYDLWFLLANQGKINMELVKLKLAYYAEKSLDINNLIPAINRFPLKRYIEDVRPFVSFSQRQVLERDFQNLKEYLLKVLENK